MSKRKHIAEFAILSFADRIAITQQNWLDEASKLDFDPHIYMIGRRPKITLKPETFNITKLLISGEVNIHRKNGIEKARFETNNLLGTTDVKLECDYPYSELRLIDKNNGKVISGMHTATILTCCQEYREVLDIEILYVGQSFSAKQNRNAVDRLKKHETLQNIYAEAMRKAPDQDIWLLLLQFTPIGISSFSTHGLENPSTSDDIDHIKNNIHSPMTDQQFISFTEAALIKYFQPEYNKVYKNIFPSPAHLTYKQCYTLDLNMIGIEIQSENVRCRLWSQSVEPKWIHVHKFYLHNEEERKNMFDVFE